MDDERVYAEISKINFLLENLYALYLRDQGVSHDRVPDLADEMARQAMLPGTTYGGEANDDAAQAQQEIVAHRLHMFFSGVRDRLRQVQEPDSQR